MFTQTTTMQIPSNLSDDTHPLLRSLETKNTGTMLCLKRADSCRNISYRPRWHLLSLQGAGESAATVHAQR